jgi:NAD kinase
MAGTQYENVIIVTRNSELDDLVARFNTKAQAKFYLEQAGQSFEAIERAHNRYQRTLNKVRQAIPNTVKSQLIKRDIVPRFLFDRDDLVITVGQDGLVSNTAKYLTGQPILAVNPDPERFDGILLPFNEDTCEEALYMALYCPRADTETTESTEYKGRKESKNSLNNSKIRNKTRNILNDYTIRQVTLAQATLSDGQTLLAFNDFFIGASSHVSARYEIRIGDKQETQSSSGIIVSTGAGSTGWLQSIYAGAAGVVEALGGKVIPPPDGGRIDWDSDHLVYSVREPFPSKATQTGIVHGTITRQSPLGIRSLMASNGIIFSDGIEADYLEFNQGAELIIETAARKANLIVPPGAARH